MTGPTSGVTRQQKTRITIVAGLMTGIIIFGTWIGAAYRETSNIRAERRKFLQSSIPDQIAILEKQRAHLEHNKLLLDTKIQNNRERSATRLRQQALDEQSVVDVARRREEERALDRQREDMLTRRRAEVFRSQSQIVPEKRK